jgi:hypothetical protein
MPDLRIEDVKENKDDDKVEDIGWSEPELWGTPIPFFCINDTKT